MQLSASPNCIVACARSWTGCMRIDNMERQTVPSCRESKMRLVIYFYIKQVVWAVIVPFLRFGGRIGFKRGVRLVVLLVIVGGTVYYFELVEYFRQGGEHHRQKKTRTAAEKTLIESEAPRERERSPAPATQSAEDRREAAAAARARARYQAEERRLEQGRDRALAE